MLVTDVHTTDIQCIAGRPGRWRGRRHNRHRRARRHPALRLPAGCALRILTFLYAYNYKVVAILYYAHGFKTAGATKGNMVHQTPPVDEARLRFIY